MLFFDSKKKVEFVDVENIHLGEHWELKRVRVYHTYILKNPWEILENAIWLGGNMGLDGSCQVVITSPLSRAIETSLLIFGESLPPARFLG